MQTIILFFNFYEKKYSTQTLVQVAGGMTSFGLPLKAILQVFYEMCVSEKNFDFSRGHNNNDINDV